MEFAFDFNIDKIKFEEKYINEEYNTITLYFIAPKEWTADQYPNNNVVGSEISVEYPTDFADAMYANVQISPTEMFLDQDGFYDFDWCDIQLSNSDIGALIELAEKTGG